MEYKTLLITGGAGFVGSNLAIAFKNKYPALKIIVLDNLRRRGSEMNVDRLKAGGIEFFHGDIRNQEDLSFNTKIDLLIECSAEPSVLASFNQPEYVINTNLLGTLNCLELARVNKADIIFLSTSRVYPFEAINKIQADEIDTRFIWRNKQDKRGWSEKGINTDFTLDGAKTLYGATKLASEIILQEYLNMYEMKGIINRCGVIAGPGQFGKIDQGIVTFWLLAHYFKKEIAYIGFGGQGKQVRDILHIEDLFNLIDKQLCNLDKFNKNIYNVGGGKENSVSLLELTNLCQEITGNRLKIGNNTASREGDITIYITDNDKVSADFQWRPQKDCKRIIGDIYNWVCENAVRLKGL